MAISTSGARATSSSANAANWRASLVVRSFQVRAQQQSLRQAHADGARGALVDRQLKPRRAFDRHLGRPRAFQDATDITRGAACQVIDVGAIAEQEAAVCKQCEVAHRRQALGDRQFGDAVALVEDQVHRVGQQRLRARGARRFDGRLQILGTPHRQPLQFQPQPARVRLQGLQALIPGLPLDRFVHHRDAHQLRHRLLQQLEPLRRHFRECDGPAR
jgi:hypothetical protein